MFMMDPPSAAELMLGGALPGLAWLAFWALLAFVAARSERRRVLTACVIASSVVVSCTSLLLLMTPSC
ncbi:MAG TPA: hypothetical protein VEQ59_23290 [Polyangiaceae bacterium]|nr:hypothetical protein [Polyangiaceae bacterium]